MDDLISRQAAIDAVGFYSLHSGDKLLFADKPLRELPSAQPEIVRCKDCIWWRDEDCTNPVGMFLPDEDDFCSCATRRKDETD